MNKGTPILRKTAGFVGFGLGLLLIAGCATTKRTNRRLLEASSTAAYELEKSLDQTMLPAEGAVLVASLVNVNDMEESSSFGRIVSDQIASAMARSHFPVAEVRLRQNIFLKEKGGEFLLSREAQAVSTKHNAQAVLVGTYAVANQAVYVSVRIVSPQTNQVLASYDYSVVLDDNIRPLLGYRRIHRPGWWGRLWGDRDVWGKDDQDYYKYFPDRL